MVEFHPTLHFNTLTMNQVFIDASPDEINQAMERSARAFETYRKVSLRDRAKLMRSIASGLEKNSSLLLKQAQEETRLPIPRLQVELKRTCFQLNSYADACVAGLWLDIRINNPDIHTLPTHQSEKKRSTDLRKMLVPLGPVVVFGASNFPFAYSTAGGDTASALAAGCTVVVKAHPAHAATSTAVGKIIDEALRSCGLPEAVFTHIHGADFSVGAALVQHEQTRAVGFTGSFQGGKALFDLAGQRRIPIPVFAEMGSVNPVFLLPGKLKAEASSVATMYATSITQSSGQFCTNPGILVAMDGPELDDFSSALSEAIARVAPEKMLHSGIARNFYQKRASLLEEAGVTMLATSEKPAEAEEGLPTLASVHGADFIRNPKLREEVFGPFSMLVRCRDEAEMLEVARRLEGQLTVSLLATPEEVALQPQLIDILKEVCGRFVFNGVPTGVEVSLAMHHGGPFPATTDSRFTSVGADAIRRFARPLCFQNWPDELLPEELRNENPHGVWRTVNNQVTDSELFT